MLGYLALFLMLHLLKFSWMAPGIPTLAWPAYLPVAVRFSPIRVINNHLLRSQPLAPEFALILLYLALCYAWILRAVRVRRETITLRTILVWVLVFSAPLFMLPRLMSQDVFIYTIEGRVSAIYGASPMLVPPSAFPADPVLAAFAADPLLKKMVAAQNSPAFYGPVWLLFSHCLTLAVNLVGHSLWLHVAAYKLAAISLHLANTVILWSFLRRWKPEQQAWGTLMYAWNPLVLLEFAGSGHNDALLLTCLLLACWAAQRGAWQRAIVGLTGAALIKYIPLLLLPLYAILLFRERAAWRARLAVVGKAVIISILLTVLLFAPFWRGGILQSHFLANPQAHASANSVGTWVVDTLLLLGPRGSSLAGAVPWATRILFGAGCVAAAIALWRRPTFERFVAASFWVLLFFVLFGQMWFQPWYAIWPLTLAALLDWRPAGRLSVVFTTTAGIVYATMPGHLAFVYTPVFALLLYEAGRWANVKLRQRASGTSSPG